jgi:hypothetical protein
MAELASFLSRPGGREDGIARGKSDSAMSSIVAGEWIAERDRFVEIGKTLNSAFVTGNTRCMINGSDSHFKIRGKRSFSIYDIKKDCFREYKWCKTHPQPVVFSKQESRSTQRHIRQQVSPAISRIIKLKKKK